MLSAIEVRVQRLAEFASKTAEAVKYDTLLSVVVAVFGCMCIQGNIGVSEEPLS